MKKLDVAYWERKEIYDFMTSFSDPFYSVSFNVDVTNVYEYTHRKGISFYYALVFLCTQAFNDVPAFLHDIVDGEIVIRDRRNPSFTDLRKGSEAFYIINLLMMENIDAFCEEARRQSLISTSFYPKNPPQDEAWIYFSCIPWIDMTAVTNERDFNADDTVPRISWGKYIDRDGRKTLNMSLEINHRFIDGYHVGQFAKCLEQRIEAL